MIALNESGGKKTRKPSAPKITIVSRAHAEQEMTAYAASCNARRKLIAERDQKILEVTAHYAKGLEIFESAIKARGSALADWALENPHEFPAKKRTIELASGEIKLSTNPPKVALLNRTWSWENVLGAIKAKAFQFIRTTEEVDKDAILAFARDAKDEADAEAIRTKVLAAVGVKIVQDESCTIEPKLTEIEQKQTVATV